MTGVTFAISEDLARVSRIRTVTDKDTGIEKRKATFIIKTERSGITTFVQLLLLSYPSLSPTQVRHLHFLTI